MVLMYIVSMGIPASSKLATLTYWGAMASAILTGKTDEIVS